MRPRAWREGAEITGLDIADGFYRSDLRNTLNFCFRVVAKK